jgi:16S rRNA (cytosine967-C5)-methyltransferase
VTKPVDSPATGVDQPRQVAFDVVRAASERGAYANLLLPQRLRATGLLGRDAAFATELTYGSLRWQGTYDALIDACAERAPEGVDPAVRDVLRIGTHQVFAMLVPDHAAVATSVELAKRNGLRRASGFVNAVLRRMTRQSWDEWIRQLTSGFDAGSDGALGLQFAHPAWMVGELRRALVADSRDPHDVVPLMVADNSAAPVTLAARPGRSTVKELVEAGAQPTKLSPLGASLDSGDPGQVAAVRERRAGVQDEGSQLVTLAVASAADASPDRSQRWLDMCAGPGGKTALLAGIAAERGAQLEAWELHEHRAELVRRQVPAEVAVRVCDSADPSIVATASEQFDLILLDAPCTGAGALRRRPESRWRRSPSDIASLASGQHRLLNAALTMVRPGGVVGYATCSPLVSETKDVIDSAIEQMPHQVSRLDVRNYLPGPLPPGGAGPDLQLWPHIHHTDAMYLALLRRNH